MPLAGEWCWRTQCWRPALHVRGAHPRPTFPAPAPQATTIGVVGDGIPDFLYDSSTGDLTFWHDGGVFLNNLGQPSFVVALAVESQSGSLLFNNASAAFRSANGTTFESEIMGGSIVTSPGFANGFDLGHVLPTGLSLATLQTDLTVLYQVLNGGTLKPATLILGTSGPLTDTYVSASSGNWSTPANWSLGRAPLSGERVVLAAGSPAQVTLDSGANAPSIASLTLGPSVGSAPVTLAIPSGKLNVAGDTYVGDAGTGTIVQSGGTHTVGGSLVVGGAAGSSGMYRLIGGNLVTGRTVIGAAGSGTFDQTGGAHVINNDLVLGNAPGSSGIYNLSSGASLSVAQTERSAPSLTPRSTRRAACTSSAPLIRGPSSLDWPWAPSRA